MNKVKLDPELNPKIFRKFLNKVKNTEEFKNIFEEIHSAYPTLPKLSLDKKILLESLNQIPEFFPKTFKDFITEDPMLKEQIEYADFIAEFDKSVLITGETGTGKEIFAKAIHASSNRKDKPIIFVNCAAIPKELFEAEMFGIKEGTATGVKGRIGNFELADQGTLFLDEIGELPLEHQTKLLRVIQEKKVTQVGCNKEIKVDFRLICATNKNILEVLDKEFRSDLYYRINNIEINLPELRNRSKRDIELLINHFLNEINKEMDGIEKVTIEKSVVDKLKKYNWPGNVRQLQSFVNKAASLALFKSSIINIKFMKDYFPMYLKKNNNEVQKN
ncbi:MAG TPA: sigma 54-interacting transcriptional regulator [Ignavibacteria bacterium]|nr:sigma 54-interacting transcriptional regulator [Ignavibacteria bacterium]